MEVTGGEAGGTAGSGSWIAFGRLGVVTLSASCPVPPLPALLPYIEWGAALILYSSNYGRSLVVSKQSSCGKTGGGGSLND